MHTPIPLALAIAFTLPMLGCQPNVDLTKSGWSCSTTGIGYQPDLGGCEIERDCGWNASIEVDPTYDYPIGNVICLGEEGGVQQCDCIEQTPTQTVVHSFEYTAACELDALRDLADQCGWTEFEADLFSEGPPPTAGDE